ncbi:MAG: segregation and condensation protein B [Verrucomicrobiales bacterium]|jgi:segregation and condensation protein B
MELKEIVESLIFASPEPISAKAIARCIRNKIDDDIKSLEEAADEGQEPDELEIADSIRKAKPDTIEEAIGELNQAYEDTGRAFRLVDGPSGWRMYSQPEYAEWVRELFPGQKPARLSGPALETLAIIAYRQPITKADIEAVRGVSVDGVLQKIIDRGLVRIAGRSDMPGKALLYATSDLFMEHFGVKEIDELPNASELRTMALPDAEGGQQNPRETEKQLALSAATEKENEEAAREELSGKKVKEAPEKVEAKAVEPEAEPVAEESEEPAAAENDEDQPEDPESEN